MNNLKGPRPAQRTVGLPGKPGVKTCVKCGKRGMVGQTASLPEHYRRRYECVCGNRWTTYEVVLTPEELKTTEETTENGGSGAPAPTEA